MDEWTGVLADVGRLRERIGALDVPWAGTYPEAGRELGLATRKKAQAVELCDRVANAVTVAQALVRQADGTRRDMDVLGLGKPAQPEAGE